MNSLGFRLDAFQIPVLVVVKKNKGILSNLESWLRGYNLGSAKQIGAPMLLIDDEADSASVNTNNPNADPTAINKAVRGLLDCLVVPRTSVSRPRRSRTCLSSLRPRTRCSGMTYSPATSFTRSNRRNYVGPSRVFVDDVTMIRYNDDAEAFFPPGHRVTSASTACRERFVMPYQARHRYDDQGPALQRVDAPLNARKCEPIYCCAGSRCCPACSTASLRVIQRDVRNYAPAAFPEALENSDALSRLHSVWLREHDNAGFDWFAIQHALNDAVHSITVRSVNRRTGAASLDYKVHKEHGLRVIAVGGNGLLTRIDPGGPEHELLLQELADVRHPHANGSMVWFRDGYDDVCRLWLSEEAEHWYGHITNAGEELRSEFKQDASPRPHATRIRPQSSSAPRRLDCDRAKQDACGRNLVVS